MKGRGEYIRLVFEEAGVPYEEPARAPGARPHAAYSLARTSEWGQVQGDTFKKKCAYHPSTPGSKPTLDIVIGFRGVAGYRTTPSVPVEYCNEKEGSWTRNQKQPGVPVWRTEY